MIGRPCFRQETEVQKEEQQTRRKIYKFKGKVGRERKREIERGDGRRLEREEVGDGGGREDEMRPNFLWQSPCSCCRCWGHFTKAGPDANVISS